MTSVRRWWTPRWRIRSLFTATIVLLIVMAVVSVTVVDVILERARAQEELEAKGVLIAKALNEVLADALYFDDVERARHLSYLVRTLEEVERYRLFSVDRRILVDSNAAKYAGGTIDEGTLQSR